MVVVIMTAAVRVVVLISTNLFNCIFCDGIHCIGCCSGVNTTTTTTTFTTSFTTIFTTHHTPNYGTSDDGGISDIGWVVTVVEVMVRYFGCWWYSDLCGDDDSCCNGGSCN